MTDMEMSESGKEKPRKNVSSLSFSRCIQWPYTSLRMTGADMVRPIERQSRAAW